MTPGVSATAANASLPKLPGSVAVPVRMHSTNPEPIPGPEVVYYSQEFFKKNKKTHQDE